MQRLVPNSRPALTEPVGSVDVAIVGAGAAGIAAARRCLAAGLSVAVLEARDRVGGRAVTVDLGGHAIDLGAHWLHAGRVNPLVRIGRERGEPLRRAPRAGNLFERGRAAGAAEQAAHGAGFDRFDRAIAEVGRDGRDRPIAAALPPLGRWRRAVAATFALISGRPLEEVSLLDFPSDEFGDNYFVRGGYGAYLGRLAAGLPIALGRPVTAIDWSGRGVRLETPGGTVAASLAVVTVPVTRLGAGALSFRPALPERTAAALGGFTPGTYEHVVLNWPGSPFHGPDRLTKLVGHRLAGLLANIDGAPFHYLELDHAAARLARSPAARARLARAILTEQFGPRALARLRIPAVTDWTGDPWSGCAWAVVPPGHTSDRAVLAEPVGERLLFAGEANSQRMWGTVGGAWEEGERAADSARELLLGRAPASFR